MECIGIDDSKAIALLRMGKNGGKAQSVKDTDVTRRKRGKDDSRHRCAVDICHFSLCIGWKRRGEPFLPAIRERFPRRCAATRNPSARLETRRLPIDHRDRETNERVFQVRGNKFLGRGGKLEIWEKDG